MRFALPVSSCARIASGAALIVALVAAAASAQTTPAKPGQGYDDPTGIPLRPPVVDVEPVWARPAIDTLATIRKRGTLRLGVVPTEPFVMRNAEGELVGFSIDIGRRLADDLGVNIEFVPTSWTQIVPDLVGNHFDVIATGFWITPARALVVNFTQPTSVGAVYLVASKALAAAMKSRQDFNRPDVKIVVYAGSSQEGLAARLFPKATLVRVEADADPLAPLMDGKAHAVLVTTPTPQLVVNHAPDRLFLPFADALQTTSTAAAIRKGDADFLNFLNSWIAFRQEDGWLTERQRYWFQTTEWMKSM
jgi:polar amino acid transport system substrate-binding protein